ncbi:MAG: DUF4381 domain-containing protein [Gammaproteobacteria bacterium]|nr:DUF4381 domain-containing protein [Gammaproteobacteria bacterium]
MNQPPLRDIHLPDPVSWWPPAIGWWLLLITLIVVLFLFYKFRHMLNRKPLKKLVVAEFNTIRQAFNQHQDQTQLAQEISVLLRRACISYQPRHQAASLTGQQWIDYLNNMTGTPCFSQQHAEILFYAPYQEQASYNADELINSCNCWISQLPGSPAL